MSVRRMYNESGFVVTSKELRLMLHFCEITVQCQETSERRVSLNHSECKQTFHDVVPLIKLCKEFKSVLSMVFPYCEKKVAIVSKMKI